MSTVGAFAAYGPLSAIGFPAFTSKDRPTSSGIGDSRPEAADQSRDRPDSLPIGSPASTAADETSRALPPVDPVVAADKDRLEPKLLGSRDPLEKSSPSTSTEEAEPLYDAQKELEAQSKRIAEQVDRFEELLRRLNEFRELTSPADADATTSELESAEEPDPETAGIYFDPSRLSLDSKKKNPLDRDTKNRLNVVL